MPPSPLNTETWIRSTGRSSSPMPRLSSVDVIFFMRRSLPESGRAAYALVNDEDARGKPAVGGQELREVDPAPHGLARGVAPVPRLQRVAARQVAALERPHVA